MATNLPQTGASQSGASRTARQQRTNSVGLLLVFIGIAIALNVLGIFFFGRLDFTKNRAFSLSEGSKRVVRNLDETMTITGYFTSDLPIPFNSTERYVRDILTEYASASNGKVRVRFVNPNTDEEKADAEQKGIQLVQHQKVDENGRSVVQGYRGIVFEYLGEREIIPVVQQDTAGLEYDVTTSIKKLLNDRLKIAVLSGHEGPTPTKGISTLARMLPTYTLSEVAATSPISHDYRALLIIDPQNAISEAELRNINQFVMTGGSLGIVGGITKVNLEGAPNITATHTDAGLNRLLQNWGVTINGDIVADAQCAQVPLQSMMGLPVPYPPSPIVALESEATRHPVLFNLNQARLFFASSINVNETFERLHGKVLMQSTAENSWLLSGDSIDLHIRHPREWQQTIGGTQRGPFIMSVALDGKLPTAFPAAAVSGEGGAQAGATGPAESEGDVRVFVISTATPFRDEFLPQGEQVNPAELAGLMAMPLNAIDWLAQDSDLIAVRAKSIEEPAIEVPRDIQEATEETNAALQTAQTQDDPALTAAIDRAKAAQQAWKAKKRSYRLINTVALPALVAIVLVAYTVLRKRKVRTLPKTPQSAS